jgi:hypothetical protein
MGLSSISGTAFDSVELRSDNQTIIASIARFAFVADE